MYLRAVVAKLLPGHRYPIHSKSTINEVSRLLPSRGHHDIDDIKHCQPRHLFSCASTLALLWLCGVKATKVEGLPPFLAVSFEHCAHLAERRAGPGMVALGMARLGMSISSLLGPCKGRIGTAFVPEAHMTRRRRRTLVCQARDKGVGSILREGGTVWNSAFIFRQFYVWPCSI